MTWNMVQFLKNEVFGDAIIIASIMLKSFPEHTPHVYKGPWKDFTEKVI